MHRFFNTAGPCDPKKHYMLPPERRIPGVHRLIDQELYFVIHAPRQVGKTTCFRTLAQTLTAEGNYAALHASCEMAQAMGKNIEGAVQAIVEALLKEARLQLPNELRPPKVPHVSSATRLNLFLAQWAETCPLPVVLFLDEIDALLDESLVSVLRQLRDGYMSRPGAFPQSVALIGLRDVRDYKVSIRPKTASLGTSSPFNIKVDSITIRNFTQDEVAELYLQHTEETGQTFTDEALEMAWDLTRGQPWLVNALARLVVEKDVADRHTPITAAHIEAAKEAIIQRRDTHLDSLVHKLREPRVRRIIEPILAGELLLGERLDDDLAYVEDLGLIQRHDGGYVHIANPIYQEVLPRTLAYSIQGNIPNPTAWYIKEDGSLDIDALLSAFLSFWKQHGEPLMAAQPYHEIAPHLVLMAFLQRIVNGGGTIDREYAVASGRMDLCIRWPHPRRLQLEALEIKVWKPKRPDPLHEGLRQLTRYLQRLELDHGVLALFDRRPQAPPIEERSKMQPLTHDGRQIILLRL